MTLTPKHEQFVVDAGLHDHLADNSETLTEILSAIGDQRAMTALSNLLSGTVCCARCHARDVRLVIECLCAAHDVPAATRPDFDAAVRWQGARLSDFHLFEG
jgi:hypothetical protein